MSALVHKRNEHGFTMAELLVVVAVIAVLVAIAIPVFTTQLEKSRRAVDLSNSRDVVAALKTGYLSGDIVFPPNSTSSDRCVVVLSTQPRLDYYASGDVKIQGHEWEYDKSNGENYRRVREYLESCGIKAGEGSSFAAHAQSADDGGWRSWAVILLADGSTRVVSFKTADFSIDSTDGKLETWAKTQLSLPETNIEIAYGGQS